MLSNSRTQLRLDPLERREVLSTTNFFDASWYLARNPDVAAAVSQGQMTAETHFRKWGDAERRSGNPLFTPSAYLDDNSDVRSAVQAGTMTAQRHFERFGQFENRNPSRDFSAHDYLDDNPDVRNAANAGTFSAFEHFLRYGEFEDRLPFHGFNRSSYLDDNPDVRAAVVAGSTTAVAHYERHGRHEGRHLASSAPIVVQSGQATVFSGVSQNHNDKKFFSFTPPTSGQLQVQVLTSNGVFAQLEIERASTSVNVFETEPNNGVNSGTVNVTAGTLYLLRVRAPQDVAAAFTVRLTLG